MITFIIQWLLTSLYLFPHWSQMDFLDLFTVSDVSFLFFHDVSVSLPIIVFLLFCLNVKRLSTCRLKSWLTIGFIVAVTIGFIAAVAAAAALATADSAGVSFSSPSLVFVDLASLTLSINLWNRHFYKLNHWFLRALHNINHYRRNHQSNMATYCIRSFWGLSFTVK